MEFWNCKLKTTVRRLYQFKLFNLAMQNKERLLIVEDDESTINIYKFALKKLFEITAARTSEEFHTVLKNEQYNMFIMDLSLRGSVQDGIELVQELRTIETYKKTPIYVITGHALNSEEQRSIDAGATEFMRKPIDLQKLINEAAVLIAQK